MQRNRERDVLCLAALALALTALGCGRSAGVPEDGAVLMRISAAGPPDTPETPDELRVWVYDTTGILFRNARVPAEGALQVEPNAKNLGSILVQPGSAKGSLRLHVRALRAGARVADGVLVVAADLRNRAVVDMTLGAAVPPDLDGDDVPDPIDDCLSAPNPDQGGCPTGGATDASSDQGIAADGGDTDAGAAPDGAEGDTELPADAETTIAGGDGAVGADVRPADAAAADSVANDGVMAGDAPRPADAAADGAARDATTEAATQQATKQLGATCALATECASRYCADGICCQTACNLPCQECVLGVCVAVTRRQDVPECSGTLTCSAAGRCG